MDIDIFNMQIYITLNRILNNEINRVDMLAELYCNVL